jgi:hypothetical protein
MQNAPKRRGRPPGSKNRPKSDAAALPQRPNEGTLVSAGSPAPSRDGGELIATYRDTAAQLQAALASETDPKVVASLSSTLNRTLWHIGKLTGEGDITESQIVRSKAWRAFLAKLDPLLERYPDFAADLHGFLESFG